jgi:hypothetical protein
VEMEPVCERVHPVGRSAACSVSGVHTTAESQAHVNLYAGGTLASSSHPATEPRQGEPKVRVSAAAGGCAARKELWHHNMMRPSLHGSSYPVSGRYQMLR